MLKSKYLIFFLSVCIFFECGFCLSARAEKLKLLILGDSLTAGYGLLPEESLPSQLQRKLKMMGYSVEVLNGGVSGLVQMYIYVYIYISIYIYIPSIFLINIIYFINPGNSHSFYLLFSFFSIIISFKTTCCFCQRECFVYLMIDLVC